MFKNKLVALSILALFGLSSCDFSLAETNVLYPDYGVEFLGQDKFEKLNRKMFNFNMKMNKYALRPLHIIWASIMPKYGMDRVQGIYENILYPRRLVSSLMQKNFEAAKNETIRFLANSTIGLGGMFDPAKRYFKIEQTDANMEQVLAKCKLKQGPYLVCPILSSASPRALVGKALDAALDPSSYVGVPFMALVKLGLSLNDSAYMQPMSYLIEATYADPYDITRKLYGVENYLKMTPPVEEDVMRTMLEVYDSETQVALLEISPLYYTENTKNEVLVSDSSIIGESPEKTLVYAEKTDEYGENETLYEDFFAQEILALYGYAGLLKDEYLVNNLSGNEYTKLALNEEELDFFPLTSSLEADIVLDGYNPQTPVVDAMRTALFDMPEVNKSIWSELSLWNRSFANRIKTSSVSLFDGRENYKFRYIMQKDKNSPVAIIYPSIGEGIMSQHSVVLAKLFYDRGYSVIIQGSHFQWAFVKSMPEDYRPGLPSNDSAYLRMVTAKIFDKLQNKYDCKFENNVLIGTSFGAMMTLFLAEKESKENTLQISKYISINPPIELLYAMNQIDKNTSEWNNNPDNLKEKVASTVAKVLNLLQDETLQKDKIEFLPFTDEEAKLITGFIMHQKLSDLIFTIENGNSSNASELYKMIRGMNYNEYAKKYLLSSEYEKVESLAKDTSLYLISDYLKNNNNYKIYHSLDDYLVNSYQLLKLKNYCQNNIILLNNGSHLGFLYRKEFLDSLKKEIIRENISQQVAKGDI